MCGRYAVTTDPATLAAEIGARDEVPESVALGPNYNVAPSTTVMVVVDRHDDGDPALPLARRVRAVRWGLIPPWSTDPDRGPLLFNARAETAAEKPAFRASARNKRCLVPMDGWYEWRRDPEAGTPSKPAKIPYYMSPKDGSRLYAAGLWSAWRPAAGDDSAWISSAAILTTDAVGGLAAIHDRMPLIMPAEHWQDWLDPDRPVDPGLLTPPDGVLVDAIEIREVVPLVNRVSNNGPELWEAAS
ncbi:MAG: SOS response-associated peptidase [Gordonia sp. (in: high G+C Gram-positive bacteria)]|uniref:SOS response-associated peptidase n=1 Tax=Gordonia sp. (in: high G+C Gram-positive bacteria) TaxID=84139 RepID=UPI0039E6F6F3